MPTDVVTNIFSEFGVQGLIIIAFFLLVWWVLKTSQEREEKLYKVIDTLSQELPEIRKTLDKIKNKMFEGD